MTEFSLAAVMVNYLLGLGKFAAVFIALYIPVHMFFSAISVRNILK